MTDLFKGLEGCKWEAQLGKNQKCSGEEKLSSYSKKCILALAGVAQWIECWPVSQRVTSSIPSQGTCLGCGPGSRLGGV